jgi:hypothetical protein
MIQARYRREQSERIRHLRVIENIVNAARFNYACPIHNGYFVCHISDYSQIVGNENDSGIEFTLQLGNQLDDLRLHRDIQRSCWFVSNKQ